MKNNCLSTRILAVFAAVLLMMTLSIPAFAATEYVFEFDEESGLFFMPMHLPEGKYNLQGAFVFEGVTCTLVSDAPIDIVYGVDPNDEFAGNVLFESSVSCSLFADGSLLVTDYIDFMCFSFDSTLIRFGVSPDFPSVEVSYFSLSPISETYSLSDYITAETLPSVFNEIISLLPVALGVLVGYISIRKGIAYLQNFLHSS